MPGTMDSIVESFFAKDKYIRKKKEEPIERDEETNRIKSMEEERNEEDSNT